MQQVVLLADAFLRTLIDAEPAVRDESNARTRMKAAAFRSSRPSRSSTSPRPRSRERRSTTWPRWNGSARRRSDCAVGPVGTGKSHSLIALGVAAVQAGHKARYFTAAELVETLYRGLADNSVGRVIENLLRADLVIIDEAGFAPLDDTGAQLLFRFVATAYERRALGIGSHWPFDQWGRFLPEHTTAVRLLDRLLHHSNGRPRWSQAGTNCHCWLAPPLAVHCTTWAPSEVDAPYTSANSPLP
ncbi:ATP-binding protein [Nonomuraea sp. NPDC050786]|uniref:ATP-binding protein n=1 Tax=Nonomuraea sp. NPDC050786 TaxID=3154840 RepID=UPI0033E7C1A2